MPELSKALNLPTACACMGPGPNGYCPCGRNFNNDNTPVFAMFIEHDTPWWKKVRVARIFPNDSREWRETEIALMDIKEGFIRLHNSPKPYSKEVEKELHELRNRSIELHHKRIELNTKSIVK